MNRYKVTLVNKAGSKRIVIVAGETKVAALSSEAFAQKYVNGEAIEEVELSNDVNHYEIVVEKFGGDLISKEVFAGSKEEAIDSIEDELFFGVGKIIEVHELK